MDATPLVTVSTSLCLEETFINWVLRVFNAVVLSVIVFEIALSDVTFEDSTFLLVTDGDSDLSKLTVVVA